MDGKVIFSHEDFSDDVIGFIYRITYSNGREYIGSKMIRSLVRLKPTKAQLAIRKNFVRKEWKNKPFAKYVGSSNNTKHLTITQKEIIEVCYDKMNLRYAETKWLFRLDVLCDEKYVNDNINGTYYTGKIVKGK